MNLFVYGTLLIPELVTQVLKLKVPVYVPATVVGYRKVRVDSMPYPLLVEDHTGVLTGAVWPNATPEAYAKIRAYEGEQYMERRVWAHDKFEKKYDCTLFVMQDVFKAGWTPEHAFNYWTKAANAAKEIVP